MTTKQKIGCTLFYSAALLATGAWLSLMGIVCSRFIRALL